jgi:hypothetical protein
MLKAKHGRRQPVCVFFVINFVLFKLFAVLKYKICVRKSELISAFEVNFISILSRYAVDTPDNTLNDIKLVWSRQTAQISLKHAAQALSLQETIVVTPQRIRQRNGI